MYKKIGSFLLAVSLLFSGLYAYAEFANPNPQSGGDNAGELLLKHESNMTDIYQSNTGKLNYLKKNFSGTSSPSSPDEGQAWWDSTNNTFNLYDGSAFGQVFPNKAATATSADTYSVTLTPAIASYITNTDYHVTFASANTSTVPTLNINSLGAKTITKEGNTALAAGDIPNNHAAILRYNGTNLVLVNPKGSTFVGYASTYAQGYRNAAQSIGDATTTKVLIDTEVSDPGNNLDLTTSRYNVPSTGYYLINAKILFGAPMGTLGDESRILLYKNGVFLRLFGRMLVASDTGGETLTVIEYLTVGDYIEEYCYQNNTANTARDLELGIANNSFEIIRLW